MNKEQMVKKYEREITILESKREALKQVNVDLINEDMFYYVSDGWYSLEYDYLNGETMVASTVSIYEPKTNEDILKAIKDKKKEFTEQIGMYKRRIKFINGYYDRYEKLFTESKEDNHGETPWWFIKSFFDLDK